MLRLVKVESKFPTVTTEHLLGDEAALRWLEIVEAIEARDVLPGLEYALTVGNALYLVVAGEDDINPLKFIVRGEVSRRYDSTPTIEVHKFKKPSDLLDFLLAQGQLMLDMTMQLAIQYPEYFDPKHVSMTGASIDFLEDPRRIRWNGQGYTNALSPLAKYFSNEDFELWSEELCDY